MNSYAHALAYRTPDGPRKRAHIRTLVVTALCEGERTCSDGRCSEDGVCADEVDVSRSTTTSSSSSSYSSSSSAFTPGAALIASSGVGANKPPSIELLANSLLSPQVDRFNRAGCACPCRRLCRALMRLVSVPELRGLAVIEEHVTGTQLRVF